MTTPCNNDLPFLRNRCFIGAMWLRTGSALLAAVVSLAAHAGSFPDRWIDGTDSAEPHYQAHAFDGDTWIIRQSLTTHFEAPFVYLLRGSERALLLDTGATNDGWLRDVVDELIGPERPLIVAHSHAHDDHVAGDAAFHSRPNTQLVGHGPDDVARFFAIDDWPDTIGRLDLGRRPLRVVPIPGHHPSSIALHDARTGLLLTGDSVYPGRIYVRDFAAFNASLERLVAALDPAAVSWVLGAHIEMTAAPGQDFGPMQPRHPNEAPLQLRWADLRELAAVIDSTAEEPTYRATGRFIVYPVN